MEELARQYAQELRAKGNQGRRHAQARPHTADYETVDLNSMSTHENRTVGGEAVAHHAFGQLHLPEILTDLGFNRQSLNQAALLIIGRLLHPASERGTLIWGQTRERLGRAVGDRL